MISNFSLIFLIFTIFLKFFRMFPDFFLDFSKTKPSSPGNSNPRPPGTEVQHLIHCATQTVRRGRCTGNILLQGSCPNFKSIFRGCAAFFRKTAFPIVLRIPEKYIEPISASLQTGVLWRRWSRRTLISQARSFGTAPVSSKPFLATLAPPVHT